MFKKLSKELDNNGNICDLLEKCFKFSNKYEKQHAKEFDSNYDDYRDNDQKEKTEYNKKKLNLLPIHEELSKLNSNKTLMDYDATSLYPSAMWDGKSVRPEIETGFAFRRHMSDIYVEAFKNKTFNQYGNESGILTIKNYNPPNLIFQHLPV